MPITGTQKPKKPYETFPLFPHTRGYWCKKIAGRQENFGPWAWPDKAAYRQSWQVALAKYSDYQKRVALDDVSVIDPGQLTVEEVTNQYLTRQQRRVEAGELTVYHFGHSYKAVKHLRDFVGRDRAISDVEADSAKIQEWLDDLDERMGWYGFNRYIAVTLAMFHWAAKPTSGSLGRPFALIHMFQKRGMKELRRARRAKRETHGKSLWEVDQLRTLLTLSAQPLRTMALLGYFCAFGNTDLAELPISAIELSPPASFGLPDGWGAIYFPRPKTEIDRAAAIPPVVVDAIRELLAKPAPVAENDPDARHLLFRTSRGTRYIRYTTAKNDSGAITKCNRIDSLNELLELTLDRLWTCPKCRMFVISPDGDECLSCGHTLTAAPSKGFYTFRHTAITHASGIGDADALKFWEGHATDVVRWHYLEEIEWHRLKSITDKLLARVGLSSQTTVQSPLVLPGRAVALADGRFARTPEKVSASPKARRRKAGA